MRIMYLIFSFTIGGAERLLVDICNEMLCKEKEIYLYIVNDYYDESLLQTIDKNVHIILQKRKPGSGIILSASLKIFTFIREKKIDVIHCNTLETVELIFLSKLLCPRIKVFQTIHDVGQYKRLTPLRRKYRNWVCKKVIAISNCVKDDLLQYNVPANKIEVVYNAINLDKFKPSAKKNVNEQIIIGNVARFEPEKKGQDVLIEAMFQVLEKYPTTICRFAGAPDIKHETVFNGLKEKVKKRGLEKNFEFLGNVDEVPKFLSGIDIFVLPSIWEGFGISLIEAMASGIPCIASNIDGPAEIIKHSKAGHLFKVSNSDDLAINILNVIGNIDEEKKKATENINYVRDAFDIKVMCNTLYSIYKN